MLSSVFDRDTFCSLMFINSSIRALLIRAIVAYFSLVPSDIFLYPLMGTRIKRKEKKKNSMKYVSFHNFKNFKHLCSGVKRLILLLKQFSLTIAQANND